MRDDSKKVILDNKGTGIKINRIEPTSGLTAACSMTENWKIKPQFWSKDEFNSGSAQVMKF